MNGTWVLAIGLPCVNYAHDLQGGRIILKQKRKEKESAKGKDASKQTVKKDVH
jgi:hypothetical protein